MFLLLCQTETGAVERNQQPSILTTIISATSSDNLHATVMDSTTIVCTSNPGLHTISFQRHLTFDLSYRFLKAIGRSSDGEPPLRAQHQQGVRFEGLHEKLIH